MNTSTFHQQKIALMTHDEHIKNSFVCSSEFEKLNITVVDYHHLLAENYDLLIVDISSGRPLPDAVLTKWKMPKILVVTADQRINEDLRHFQALLPDHDISQGLLTAIAFAKSRWEHEQILDKKINDFEFR